MKTRALVAAAMLTAVFLPAATSPFASADVIGKITYLEGTLEIVRDEDTLAAKIVKTGFALENFDLLITGADGEVELQIASQMAPPTTVRVAPRTRFSLEIGKMGSKHQTTVGLMIGTVSVKCAKLTGSQSVKVQTDTTIMGVRGTNFTVTAAASGHLLVDCDEGEVECVDEGGKTERAKPGEVVEQLFGEPLLRRDVAAANLPQYREDWGTARISALKANALKATSNFANRYNLLLEKLKTDFQELQEARPIIDKWRAEDRTGRTGTETEAMKEKKQLIGPLIRLYITLRRLEPIYARLLVLKEYHDGNIGRGIIRYDDNRPPEATEHFFERFKKGQPYLQGAISRFRAVTRMFARHNEGRVPWGSFEEEEGKESFFGGTENFFDD